MAAIMLAASLLVVLSILSLTIPIEISSEGKRIHFLYPHISIRMDDDFTVFWMYQALRLSLT
jgi:hypothetical protein